MGVPTVLLIGAIPCNFFSSFSCLFYGIWIGGGSGGGGSALDTPGWSLMNSGSVVGT